MTTVSAANRAPSQRTWRLDSAINDLIEGVRHWELWSTLGWLDIRQRYRRSVVGPFWLTLSMGMMIGGLAYLYAGMFGQKLDDYLPYVALGMIVFNLISTMVTDGSMSYIWYGPVIVQLRAPLSIYIYRMVWRNLLIFFHNIVIFVLVCIFVKSKLGWNSFLAIPGLLLVVSIGTWISLLLAGLCARFRDVPPIISSVMQIAFFLTPVFWTPTSMPGRELFVHLNPFYYLVEIVRMPLLGETPPLFVWLGAIGLNCVAALLAILFLARCRHRIAYWV